LINEIYEDLRLNYFTNLPKGEGTADTALNFANSNQINIEISKKDEGIVINNFRSLDKDKNHKIEVKFELPKNEQTKDRRRPTRQAWLFHQHQERGRGSHYSTLSLHRSLVLGRLE